MRFANLLVGLAALVVCLGCADPKIDGTSDETMKQSVQKVRNSLPESRRGVFDDALQILAFSELDFGAILADGAAGAGTIEAKMREALNGKTGEQVIAEAEKIKSEREARERQQALDEIQELEGKRAEAELARRQLAKFVVTRSRFFLRNEEYVGKQPIIELSVRNGTASAISRAYFEGTVASPGRSVPWHKDTFNYAISGGLEPGESANWSLAPNMFSDWGKLNLPRDAVFTVTVEQLDGADGEPLFTTKDFDAEDLKRLNELKKTYEVE